MNAQPPVNESQHRKGSDVRATHQRRRRQGDVADGGFELIDRRRCHHLVSRKRLYLDFEFFSVVFLLFRLIGGKEGRFFGGGK